ncbi:MAG: hypothetical protein P4L42_10190 [Desulfocapsaceae bacterium]|nr:hypothetical protein [Desulfocapsaceae bacterium]
MKKTLLTGLTIMIVSIGIFTANLITNGAVETGNFQSLIVESDLNVSPFVQFYDFIERSYHSEWPTILG